jgi:RNA polymerase sigma factor (sigma-70 family)
VAELLEELLERCKRGDGEAVAILVRRFGNWAQELGAALLGDWHLGEDAVQGAFVSAIRRLVDLRDAKAFPGWFRQIVRTEANRIARHRRELPLVHPQEQQSDEPSPLGRMQREELRHLVREALAALPPASRQAAELFYLEQREQRDVADLLKIPKGTVKRRLHDARRQLRAMLLGYIGGQGPPPSKKRQLPL